MPHHSRRQDKIPGSQQQRQAFAPQHRLQAAADGRGRIVIERKHRRQFMIDRTVHRLADVGALRHPDAHQLHKADRPHQNDFPLDFRADSAALIAPEIVDDIGAAVLIDKHVMEHGLQPAP